LLVGNLSASSSLDSFINLPNSNPMKTKKAKPLLIIALLGTVAVGILAWILDNLRFSKTTTKSTTPSTTAANGDTSEESSESADIKEVKTHLLQNVSFTENQTYEVSFPAGWKASMYVVEITDELGAAVLADIPPATRTATGFSVSPTFSAQNLTIRIVALI